MVVGDTPIVASVPFAPIDVRAAGALEIEATVTAAFDAYAAALKGFAAAAVRDRDVADDLVQECFLRLVHQLRAGHQIDNLRGWLFTVCANQASSHLRHTSVRDRARSLLVDRWTWRSAEEAAIRRSEDDELEEALSRLRAEERVALLLSASGLSAAEVGAAIGKTPNATRVFICRARIHLRKHLAAREGTDR